MAEYPTPICDAIDARFDAWDNQIDELKEQAEKAAKEQVEKIKKDVEDYVKTKVDELTKQDEETKKKTAAANTIIGFNIENITKPEDTIQAVKSMITFLQDVANCIIATAKDIAEAPNKLRERSKQTLGKLTEV